MKKTIEKSVENYSYECFDFLYYPEEKVLIGTNCTARITGVEPYKVNEALMFYSYIYPVYGGWIEGDYEALKEFVAEHEGY